jgi:hypothetical protein
MAISFYKPKKNNFSADPIYTMVGVVPGGELWSEQTTVEGVKIQYIKVFYCGFGRELVGKNRPEYKDLGKVVGKI